MPGPRKLSIEENLRRFHANYVKREDGCWEWIAAGARCGFGHGVTRYDGKKWMAHRLAYKLFKGDPGDLCVCHSCDNPRCVNPDHLWLGTQQDNMLDRDRKSRGIWYSGEENAVSKLNADAVKQIIARWKGGESQNRISKDFGIRQGTVSHIVRGKNWRHVTEGML